MQKWEYCVVGHLWGFSKGLETYFPFIGYFKDNGLDETSLKGKPEMQRVASVIAKLGNEGWEMSGCGRTGTRGLPGHLLYFKRPVE